MKTKLIITAILAVAIGTAAGWYASHQTALANVTAAADGKILYYICPMHPNIHYNHPGDCPICGMKLQPVYANETNAPVTLPSCCGGGNY